MKSAEQQTHKPSLKIRLGSYGINHLRSLLNSLGRLYSHKLASIMTLTVIAIALALPTGFYILLNNASKLSDNWDSSAKISAYLANELTDSGTQDIAKQIMKDSRVSNIQIINADEAFEEFKSISGFGSALDALDNNPLPSVIIVQPLVDIDKAAQIEQLKNDLAKIDGIDQIKLDMQWLQRLFAIMRIIEKTLMIIAVFLAIAVILTIGNTIRLDIQSRRDEIIVQKLIGATNAFVRRPFLYIGIWYGFLGGILAWLFIAISMQILSTPIKQLSALYSSDFTLHGLSFSASLQFLLLSIVLGFLGSWLAVTKHLVDIEPE